MLFGITLPERGPQSRPDSLTRIALKAEELGFHAVEMGDHIVIPESIRSTYPYTPDGRAPDWEDWNEQVTTLAFLAGRTSKIHVITAVLILPYRSPLLAAKMLATLDVLSKGRLIVGVGVGWMEEEFEALRVPPFAERGRVADEYIRLFKTMWTKDRPEFRGTYFSVEGVKFLPKPAQKPRPPIWVGGESPAAMRRAATEGDVWYPIGSNPRYPLTTMEELTSAVEELRAVSRKVGRKRKLGVAFVSPRFKVEKGAGTTELFVGSAEKIISDIRGCEKLGVSYISFDLTGRDLEQTLSQMTAFAKKIAPLE
jgi:probable F420-dependent oxidoreductase